MKNNFILDYKNLFTKKSNYKNTIPPYRRKITKDNLKFLKTILNYFNDDEPSKLYKASIYEIFVTTQQNNKSIKLNENIYTIRLNAAGIYFKEFIEESSLEIIKSNINYFIIHYNTTHILSIHINDDLFNILEALNNLEVL